jgi:hypothetical protein
MKNFRRLCFAIVLAAVFSVSAFADGGVTQGPPEPGDGHSPGASIRGDVQTPGAPDPGDSHTPGAPTAFGDILTPGFVAMMLRLLSFP